MRPPARRAMLTKASRGFPSSRAEALIKLGSESLNQLVTGRDA
jgi:hypothetical protein